MGVGKGHITGRHSAYCRKQLNLTVHSSIFGRAEIVGWIFASEIVGGGLNE